MRLIKSCESCCNIGRLLYRCFEWEPRRLLPYLCANLLDSESLRSDCGIWQQRKCVIILKVEDLMGKTLLQENMLLHMAIQVWLGLGSWSVFSTPGPNMAPIYFQTT